MLSYFRQLDSANEIASRLSLVLQIFQFLDDNIGALYYYDAPNFETIIRKKLIELSKDGSPTDIAKHYFMKWFDAPLPSSVTPIPIS